MSVLFFMLKQFVKLGRGREGLDLLGFSPNLHPKLLSILLVVDRCPRFSGDASRISNAFTYLFSLLILIHLRFKEWLSEKTGQNVKNVNGRGSTE